VTAGRPGSCRRGETTRAWRSRAGFGDTWETLRKGLPQEHTYDVVHRHALDARNVHLCFGTTTGNIYVSEDEGDSWTCVGNNSPPVHSVRFS
jgi:hypothetical protein